MVDEISLPRFEMRPLSELISRRVSGLTWAHSSTQVTEIYLWMVGEEQRRLVMEAWES